MSDDAYFLPDDWMDSIDFGALCGPDGSGAFSGVPDDVEFGLYNPYGPYSETEPHLEGVGFVLDYACQVDATRTSGPHRPQEAEQRQKEPAFPPLPGPVTCPMINEALVPSPESHFTRTKVANDGSVSDPTGLNSQLLVEDRLKDASLIECHNDSRHLNGIPIVDTTSCFTEFVSGFRIISDPPTSSKLTQRGGGAFKCQHQPCRYHEEGFKRKYELERHIKQKHSNPDEFLSCPVSECRRRGKEGFPRSDKLISHLSHGHDSNDLYECPAKDCDQRPASLWSMHVHVRRCHTARGRKAILGIDFVRQIQKYACPLPYCKMKGRERNDIWNHLHKQHTAQDRLSVRVALKELGVELSTGRNCCPMCGNLCAGIHMLDHLRKRHFRVDELHLEAWTHSVSAVHPSSRNYSPLITRRLSKPWNPICFNAYGYRHESIVCEHCKSKLSCCGDSGSIHHFGMLSATDELRQFHHIFLDMVQGFKQHAEMLEDAISNVQNGQQPK